MSSAPPPPHPPGPYPQAPPPQAADDPASRAPEEPKKRRKWGKPTAILGLLTALLGLTTAILGVVAHDTAQKNESLTINYNEANSARASAEQSVTAAQSTISSLKSQLAEPTASPSGPVTPTDRNSGIVTIASGTRFDFDGTGKTWQEPSGSADVTYYGNGSGLYLSGNTAVIIPTQATYDSCQTTGYGTPDISVKANLPSGTYICLKTDEHRYVALKLLAISANSIQFDAASYDPPDANS